VVDGIEDTALDPRFPLSWGANGLVTVPTTNGAVAFTTISGFGSDTSELVSLRELVGTHVPNWDRAAA
jgi:hypothetical protein